MGTRRFLLSALISICSSGVLLAQGSSGSFVNGNFETGDFTGWTHGGGTWGFGDYPLDPASFLPGGNKYNARAEASTVLADPQTADPRTEGNLNPIYNGHHTAKINDENAGSSVSVISQTVANYSAPQIYFAWAAVLQQSGHQERETANFTLQLTDDTTREVLYRVAYNTYQLEHSSGQESQQQSPFTYSSRTGWYYTSWQVQTLDVGARTGHTFTLRLLAADCDQGGHAGYVYLDGFGSVAPPTGGDVGNDNNGTPLTVNSVDLGVVASGGTISGGLSATGGTPPYTWTVLGAVPPGATAGSGSLVVTGGAPGTYRVSFAVTDSLGSSAAGTITYTVFGLTTQSLPNATQFAPYIASVALAGGSPPYTFTASGLPAGLSISSSGVIQGVARANGTSTVALTITDAAGRKFSTTLALTVAAPLPLRVTSSAMTPATERTAYSDNLAAVGGAPPYTWSLVSGALPQGLNFHANGSITGTAAVPGSYSFVVRATDFTGASVTGGVTLVVNPLALTIVNPSPFPTGYAGFEYPATMFGATGGVAPYRFTVSNGSLPAGLSLSTAGLLSGVPTSAGTSNFTVLVTDAAGHTGTASPGLTIRPLVTDVSLSSGSLVFNQVSGSALLASAQNVAVQSTNTAVAIPFITTVTPASVNWLNVTTSGTTPGAISVSLNNNVRQLAGGETPYQANVKVTCVLPAPCAGSSQNILVAMNLTIAPPALTISSDLLSFSSVATTGTEMSQQLTLQNVGGGSVGFASVSCGAPWCSVSGVPAFLSSGLSAAAVVTANPAGLNAGFYRTTLEIRASTGSYSIPVTFYVANGASITVQPAGSQFMSSAGGMPVGPTRSFYVQAAGPNAIPWTASVLPGAAWLTVNTASGTATSNAPGVVNFSIDPAAASALSAGAYYGRIHVVGTGAPAPQDFEVVLNVAPAGTPLHPNPSPQGLLFITSSTTPPPPQAVQVAVGSPAPVPYQTSASTTSGGNWLLIDSTGGTATPSSPGQTLVSVNPTGLAPGVYYGGVSYAYNTAAVRTVNVTMIVTPAGAGLNGLSRTTSQLAPRETSCAPKLMVPAQVGLVNNFSAPTAWPTPLMLQVMSDCGSPVTNAQVVATFSNGDSPLALSLANPQNGIYSGTWTPRHVGAQVTVSARASAPGLPTATATLSGAVTPNDAPVLTPHSTLHVFDPQVGAGLGPGTIIQMYGQFLAPQTTLAQSIPLATKLSGTSVVIGGIEAPLYFVSAGQVNAQIPFELQPGQQYQVIVNANGALTTPDTIQLTPVSPGLAALADGTVIAQHGDGSLVSETAPAKPGEFLVMYVAGLGATDNSVTTGAASPSSPLARPQDMPTLSVGGQSARVLFAGLTPGLVGLYQVNFEVPPGAPNGDLNLVLSQNSAQSNSTILPIHN